MGERYWGDRKDTHRTSCYSWDYHPTWVNLMDTSVELPLGYNLDIFCNLGVTGQVCTELHNKGSEIQIPLLPLWHTSSHRQENLLPFPPLG